MQQIDKIGWKKGKKPMRWLPALPALREGEDPGLREFMGGVEEEIRAMVGEHYYFISCGAGGPSLCRVPLTTRGQYPREVIDHAGHGITEDDLYHAMGAREGNIPAPGYYPISDHIEGKLRALLDA